MARPVDVEKLGYDELIDLQKRVELALENKKAGRVEELRSQFGELAASAGLSLEDVMGRVSGGRGGKRGKVPVKYINPKDKSQTWTGRGRTPRWLADAMKKGAKRESFEI